MSNGSRRTGGLRYDEIFAFVADWYRKLDEHVPTAEIVPLVADAGLEFVLPEGVLRGREAFSQWYARVIALFFDEIHTLRSVDATPSGDGMEVRVVVNWQARRWRPPAPRSEWLGFDAYQTWQIARVPASVQPMITRYVVNELRPMPGSPAL